MDNIYETLKDGGKYCGLILYIDNTKNTVYEGYENMYTVITTTLIPSQSTFTFAPA